MEKTRESFTGLYAEKFGSPKEFVRTLKRRRSEEKIRYPYFSPSKTEYQVSSYKEAYSLFPNPWEGMHDNIERRFEKSASKSLGKS